MAEGQFKLRNCSVCFENFDGYNLGRLLPCGGTLCEKCIGELLDVKSIDCPECGTEHPAENGIRSFPESTFGQSEQWSVSVANKKTGGDRCKEHGKHPSIYCKETYCKRAILYLQTHTDIVDLDTEDKEIEALFTDLETAVENLRFYKARIATLKENIGKKNACCLDRLEARKSELLKLIPTKGEVATVLSQRFDELLKEVYKYIAEVNTNIDAEMAIINKHLTTLDSIREITHKTPSTYEDIKGRLDMVKIIEADVKSRLSDKSYEYCEYTVSQASSDIVKRVKEHFAQRTTGSELSITEVVDSFCGHLRQKEELVNSADNALVVSVKQEATDKSSTGKENENISDNTSIQVTAVAGPSSEGTSQKRNVELVTPQEFFDGSVII